LSGPPGVNTWASFWRPAPLHCNQATLGCKDRGVYDPRTQGAVYVIDQSEDAIGLTADALAKLGPGRHPGLGSQAAGSGKRQR
jgi:hypothetical protein